VIKGGAVQTLAYQIGTPFAVPTSVFDPSAAKNSSRGCIFDPGNDNGTETFQVIESGIGDYAVSLDEQLTPAQEANLRQLAEQQAEAQRRQEQQQAQAQQQAAQQAAQAQAQASIDNAEQTCQPSRNSLAEAFLRHVIP
jgi:hypothetical protein